MKKIADINVAVPDGITLTALFETEYGEGNLAVVAHFSEYGEQNAISVNLPDQAFNLMQPGEFFLKSYSEREGWLEALLAAGIVTHDGTMVRSGYVEIPLVRLNVGEYKHTE